MVVEVVVVSVGVEVEAIVRVVLLTVELTQIGRNHVKSYGC
jgi:hypothetical protein